MTRQAIAALALVTSLALPIRPAAAEPEHARNDTEHQEDTSEATPVNPQKLCPVMGGTINPDLYVDANGKRIYVCCKGCMAAIEKDHAAYSKKIADNGEVVADTPKKAQGSPQEHDGHGH